MPDLPARGMGQRANTSPAEDWGESTPFYHSRGLDRNRAPPGSPRTGASGGAPRPRHARRAVHLVLEVVEAMVDPPGHQQLVVVTGFHELAAVEEHSRWLQARVFPDLTIGLVHGRTPAAERDAVMSAFAEGRVQILVATTVIEVGIDVPAASIMIIEHAGRFGISQLHQLRGRIGRGAAKSYCFLMKDETISSDGSARLSVLETLVTRPQVEPATWPG